MSLLSRADLSAMQRFKTIDVEVPAYAVTVRLRSLSAAQRDDFDASLGEYNDQGVRSIDLRNMRAKLVALTAIDEAGDALGDAEFWGEQPSDLVGPLFLAAQKLNAMDPASVAAAEKNS